MFLARYALLLDGGFVTKKLQQKLKQPATADDVVALCDEIRGHDSRLAEITAREMKRYGFTSPPTPGKN